MHASKTLFAQRWTLVGSALAVALSCLGNVAQAQTAGNNREQEQLRRMRQQMQQLQQQQSEMQEAQLRADQQRAQAESVLKDKQRELQGQKDTAAKANRKAAALSQEINDLTQAKAHLTEQVRQLTEQLQSAQQQLAQEIQQKDQTQRNLTRTESKAQQLNTALDQCRTDNAQLYVLGRDLLQRYEHKGWREVMATKEPFFQYARVTLENTKHGYQDKLDSLRSPVEPKDMTDKKPSDKTLSDKSTPAAR